MNVNPVSVKQIVNFLIQQNWWIIDTENANIKVAAPDRSDPGYSFVFEVVDEEQSKFYFLRFIADFYEDSIENIIQKIANS